MGLGLRTLSRWARLATLTVPLALLAAALQLTAAFTLYPGLASQVAPGFALRITATTMAAAMGLTGVAVLLSFLRVRSSEVKALAWGFGVTLGLAVVAAGVDVLYQLFAGRPFLSATKPALGLALTLAVAGALAWVAQAVAARVVAAVSVRSARVILIVGGGLAGLRLGVPDGLIPKTDAKVVFERSGERPLPPDTPVVLLSVDTLRADHMSLYGYARATTPRLDAWAEAHVVFDRAITPKTCTAPAMASLFTGVHPYLRRLPENGEGLGEPLITLPEIFREAGYRTGAFVTNRVLNHKNSGFDQGFPEKFVRYPFKRSDAEIVLEEAFAWIDAQPDSKVLAWIHLEDPHTPYTPPAPFDTRFVDDAHFRALDHVPIELTEHIADLGQVSLADALGLDWRERFDEDDPRLRDLDFYVAQYDGEIAYLDQAAGAFLDKLKARFPNALVLFLADHGESLAEHRYYLFHGRYCYEASAHVPLVVAHPELSGGRRVGRLVSLVDVVPTLAELFGLALPAHVQGRSFAGVLRGDTAESEAPTFIASMDNPAYPTLAVRSRTHKLIMTPDRRFLGLDAVFAWQMPSVSPLLLRRYVAELYDLRADRMETKNHADEDEALRRDLESELWAFLRRQHALDISRDMATDFVPSPEVLEELRALGYFD